VVRLNIGGGKRIGIIDKSAGRRFFYFVDLTSENDPIILFIAIKWYITGNGGSFIEFIGEHHPELLKRLNVMRLNKLMLKRMEDFEI